MNSGITIIEKPEWISWDDIQECQRQAHLYNHEHGINMLCSSLSGDQLSQEIGNGTCIVALDGRKVIGTCSVKYVDVRKWWCRGKSAYLCMGAVLPNYHGKGVYSSLCEYRNRKVINDDLVSVVWMNTAERNKRVQDIYAKEGFKKIQYSPTENGADYYSVIMAKRVKGNSYSRFYDLMFFLSRILVKIIWKPGRIPRISLSK